MQAVEQFKAGLQRNRAGNGGAAVSVCSAHPDVLRAVLRSARQYQTFALIESTSNQVNQDGGYTGLQPADFAARVHRIAREERFPEDAVLLGGDHLGPQAWRGLPARQAMDRACSLAAACVAAGYRKIHLDASFPCRGDAAPLPEETVAHRCAQMAAVCESCCGDRPPLYVIGTEVPPPGGGMGRTRMRVTPSDQVQQTLEIFRAAFRKHHLQPAWERVVAVVVQPGVDFGDDWIREFRPARFSSDPILNWEGMVYEAHSTDYQTSQALKALARRHFYILKVGPWLTYTLREGLYLLELMERELRPSVPSRFRRTLLAAMQRDPRHWHGYYQGSAEEIEFKLSFSYFDRARYYLADGEVRQARDRLLGNLEGRLPECLISQFMPRQYDRIRSGQQGASPRDLLVDRVAGILDRYMTAGR